MAQNDDPRGPSHKSNVDSVEVVAEPSADGAYEIRLARHGTGAQGAHLPDATPAPNGGTTAGLGGGQSQPVATKKRAVPAVLFGTVLVAVGGFVAYNSLGDASPPAPSRSTSEASQGSNDGDGAGSRRRTVTPVEGFRVYQGEGGWTATTSTRAPAVNLDIEALRARDAGASVDADAENEAPEQAPDEALQPEPSLDEELPPEVIQRMQEVPVFVPEQIPPLPRTVAPQLGAVPIEGVQVDLRLPSPDEEGMGEDDPDDFEEQRN